MRAARFLCAVGWLLMLLSCTSFAETKEQEPSAKLREAFSAVNSATLEMRGDLARIEVFRTSAEQVLSAAGLRVALGLRGNAQIRVRADAKCRVNASGWHDPLTGEARFEPPLCQIGGNITVELPRAGSYSSCLKIEAGAQLPAGATQSVAETLAAAVREIRKGGWIPMGFHEMELPMSKMPPEFAEAVFWEKGSIADTLVQMIGSLAGPARIAPLMRSTDPRLRAAATRSLAALGDEGALDMLSSQRPPEENRVVYVVSQSGNPSTLELGGAPTPTPDRRAARAAEEPTGAQLPEGQIVATAPAAQPTRQEAPDEAEIRRVAPETRGPEVKPQPVPFAGDYKGIYSGAELGELAGRVEEDGRFNVIAQSPSAGRFTATGIVQNDGRVSAQAQGGPFTITFEGEFRHQGDAAVGSGAWRSSSGFRGKWRVEQGDLDANTAGQFRQLAAMANEGESHDEGREQPWVSRPGEIADAGHKNPMTSASPAPESEAKGPEGEDTLAPPRMPSWEELESVGPKASEAPSTAAARSESAPHVESLPSSGTTLITKGDGSQVARIDIFLPPAGKASPESRSALAAPAESASDSQSASVSEEAKRMPLHAAALRGNPAEISALIEKGLGVNTRNAEGLTPLHLASMSGCKDAMIALLAHGAEVNARSTFEGLKPARSSVSYLPDGSVIVTNANVSYPVFAGLTPLHLAAGKDAAEILLQNGADVNARTSKGGTPLLYAVKRGAADVVTLLLSRGADTAVSDEGWTGTLLHVAVDNNCLEVAELLLRAGAPINAKTTDWVGDRGRWTPLRLAVHRGYTRLAALLLAQGADVNGIGDELYAAVFRGDKEIVELLLAHGVAVNNRGGTFSEMPLQAALEKKYHDIADILRQHGATQ